MLNAGAVLALLAQLSPSNALVSLVRSELVLSWIGPGFNFSGGFFLFKFVYLILRKFQGIIFLFLVVYG